MTEPLPEPAPVEEPAAPSVEVDAPGNQSEVESGSTQEAVVPASRFNGLMSSFNKTKADLDAAVNELAALRSQPRETQPVSDELQSEVAALRQELREERLNSAKARILEQYPEAKEFADLFVSDSPESMESLAKDISERVKRVTAPVSTTTETTQVVTPAEAPASEPVVTAGGATIPDGAPAQEQVQTAIAEKSWTKYFAAKSRALSESGAFENAELSA